MDFFMGLKGPDFALVASDTAAIHSIITIKQDEDKIVPIDSHKVFCLAGEAGDRGNFSEFVSANVKLYALRNDTALSTRAVANYARGELAAALRKSPYHCNLLVAGFDKGLGPSIFWLDHLATLHKINTGGTGYGSYFALSLLDRLWRPDLSLDEAVVVMEKAIAEIRLRLAMAPAKFVIKVVDKDGVRELKRL